MARPVLWIVFARAYPLSTVTPGMWRASVYATWSNVLWSSLRTITRQLPPRPLDGSPVRGSSTVSLTRASLPAALGMPAREALPDVVVGHRLGDLLGHLGRLRAHLGVHAGDELVLL